jgi:integrase
MKELNNVKLRVSRLFPAFNERMQIMEKSTLISGRSQRTFDNYSMYLAIFVEKVQKMPEDATDAEIDDFLFRVLKNHPSNSQSSIRTHVYALRFYFRLFGMGERSAKLPKLVIRPKLPVVLSEEEVRRILISIKNDMHRIMLATMYSLGMRISELMNLKWENIFYRVFLNRRWAGARRWAVYNFQWASNLVILLSFTTKLYNFIIIQH